MDEAYPKRPHGSKLTHVAVGGEYTPRIARSPGIARYDEESSRYDRQESPATIKNHIVFVFRMGYL